MLLYHSALFVPFLFLAVLPRTALVCLPWRIRLAEARDTGVHRLQIGFHNEQICEPRWHRSVRSSPGG